WDPLLRIPPREGSQHCALEPQQLLLPLEPAAVADEAARGADDAMAREDDRERIAVHHHADGARGLRAPGPCRQLAVRLRVPVGDLRELGEDGHCEARLPTEVDGQVDRAPTAGEVLLELGPGVVDRARSAEDARAGDAG